MSLNAAKLFAMAAKLEEEGIITPNTEVEVSASVSVTPEEQEKIDEAITEVEEIATADAEINESVEEVEELEEAATTLSAIRDAIKRDGIVTPQLYAFLQDSGYLSAIAAFQKNVSYPATEAISNVSLNKQYADAIVAGCEAGLRETGKAIWKWLVELFERAKKFCSELIDKIVTAYQSTKIAKAINAIKNLRVKDANGFSQKDKDMIANAMERFNKEYKDRFKDENGYTQEQKDNIANSVNEFMKKYTHKPLHKKAMDLFNSITDKLPTHEELLNWLSICLELLKSLNPFKKEVEAEEKELTKQAKELEQNNESNSSEEVATFKQKAIYYAAYVRDCAYMYWLFFKLSMLVAYVYIRYGEDEIYKNEKVKNATNDITKAVSDRLNKSM